MSTIREILDEHSVVISQDGDMGIWKEDFDKLEKELTDSLKDELADKIDKETYVDNMSEDNLVEHIVNEIRKFKPKEK